APRDGWRFVKATGTAAAAPTQRLAIYLGEAGSALIDDVSVVAGTNAEVGFNYVRNGDFESPLLDVPPITNSWLLGTNYTNFSLIVGSPVHSGSGALKMVGTQGGTFGNPPTRAISQWLSPAPPPVSTNTLSF